MRLAPEEIVPSKESVASDWIIWHKSMKKAGFGPATSNKLFLDAWQDRGCKGIGFTIGCEANTTELREYVQKQGFKVDGGVFDFVPDTWDEIGDFTSQAFNVTKYTFLIILFIMVAFLGMLAYNIGRDPKMVIDAGSSIAKARMGGGV